VLKEAIVDVLGVDEGDSVAFVAKKFCQIKHGFDVPFCWKGQGQ